MTTADHPVTRAELKEELNHYATKADLANAKADIIKWIAGSLVAGMAAVSAVVVAFERLLG